MAGGGAEMLVPKRGKPPITTCPGGKVTADWFHTVTYGRYVCAAPSSIRIRMEAFSQLSEAS